MGGFFDFGIGGTSTVSCVYSKDIQKNKEKKKVKMSQLLN